MASFVGRLEETHNKGFRVVTLNFKADWSFWNAGDQQEVVRFDLTSYLITRWPRVGSSVFSFFNFVP